MLTLKPHAQKGATLIVALIFLLVLTAAGLTAMRFSSLEERMASNTQFHNDAFQLAQSEIRAQLQAFNASAAGRAPMLQASNNRSGHGLSVDELKLFMLPATSSAAFPLTVQLTLDDLDNVTFPEESASTAKRRHGMRYLSERICDDGTSVNKFSCTHYEIMRTAQLSGGARSSQTQGFVFMTNK